MSTQTLKCGICNKDRLLIRFSKTTVSKYRESERLARARRDPSIIRLPRCSECNTGSIQELKCALCTLTRGLDDFSKAQRRNPDNALCKDCSQSKQDIEARHEDQVQEEKLMDELRTGAVSSDIMSKSTILSHNAQSGNGALTNTNIDNASDWINPPVPIPVDPRAISFGGGNSRAGSVSGVSNISHGSNPSNISNGAWSRSGPAAVSYRGEGSNRSDRSSVAPGKNAGFVKQGAVKVDPRVKAQDALLREQNSLKAREEQAYRQESDSDDDSDDDPY